MNVDLEVNSQTVGLIAVEDKCTDSDVGPAKATFTFSEAFFTRCAGPTPCCANGLPDCAEKPTSAYSLVQCSLSLSLSKSFQRRFSRHPSTIDTFDALLPTFDAPSPQCNSDSTISLSKIYTISLSFSNTTADQSDSTTPWRSGFTILRHRERMDESIEFSFEFFIFFQ